MSTMSRIPLAEAALIAGVKPGTIRRWVHDGRLTRHWNGYNLHDLIHARDTRNLNALLTRAGITQDQRPGQVA